MTFSLGSFWLDTFRSTMCLAWHVLGLAECFPPALPYVRNQWIFDQSIPLPSEREEGNLLLSPSPQLDLGKQESAYVENQRLSLPGKEDIGLSGFISCLHPQLQLHQGTWRNDPDMYISTFSTVTLRSSQSFLVGFWAMK